MYLLSQFRRRGAALTAKQRFWWLFGVTPWLTMIKNTRGVPTQHCVGPSRRVIRDRKQLTPVRSLQPWKHVEDKSINRRWFFLSETAARGVAISGTTPQHEARLLRSRSPGPAATKIGSLRRSFKSAVIGCNIRYSRPCRRLCVDEKSMYADCRICAVTPTSKGEEANSESHRKLTVV